MLSSIYSEIINSKKDNYLKGELRKIINKFPYFYNNKGEYKRKQGKRRRRRRIKENKIENALFIKLSAFKKIQNYETWTMSYNGICAHYNLSLIHI